MRQHVLRGGLCYEPFSGFGSQIMAGEANGRRVLAKEISPIADRRGPSQPAVWKQAQFGAETRLYQAP